jgi:hypothetical protein
LKIFFDFSVGGRVMRKREGCWVTHFSDVDPRLVDVCLILIMSKPKSTSPSEMSWTGVLVGRCTIALIDFSDFGWKVN